ncbi:MAG TPA: hypothetical protein VHA70_01960 [Bauldia sp.]|nr:hypothetical protein [Bauldia sp.]
MVKVTILNDAKIGTFFKADTGGKIIADGLIIEGGDVGRLAEATRGGSISVRGAKVHSKIGDLAKATTFGTIDLSDAEISLISSTLASSDIDEIVIALHKASGDILSVEEAIAILDTLNGATTTAEIEPRLRKSEVAWKVVERAGGIAGILHLLLAAIPHG